MLITMTKDGVKTQVHPTAVADHRRAGWSVAPETAQEAPAEPVSAVPAAPHAVVIPNRWRALGWPQKRSLASKLTDEPIRDGAIADRVIAAEVARREG
jgi:hypothetical protein